MTKKEKADFKFRIISFVSGTPSINFFDISEHLNIDLRSAVGLCKELLADGEIEPDER